MFRRMTVLLAATVLFLAPVAARAAITPYTQNFESLVLSDPGALGADGWVVYGNAYSPAHAYLYGYGTFPAPNNGGGFCAIDGSQGGAEQGIQQLSVYGDYNNGGQATGDFIEANTFREQTVSAADVNGVWTFQFDAKLGNLSGQSTALAFIKTLNPAAGWALTNYLTVNTTAIPATWNTYTIEIPITPDLTGQVLQFGFSCTETMFEPSGVYYDNIVWSKTSQLAVPAPRADALELRAATPNPFAGATRIEWVLAARGDADVSVFDVTGRRIATLFTGDAGAGPHAATWDGRTDGGALAPAGVYHCVLRTPAGTRSRSVVLGR